jgi:predicted nucleotidyltransferase
MKTAEDLLSKLEDNLPRLRREYGVKSLGLFGSYLRGEQKSDSDVDILVDFDEPIGLLKFMDLELHLTELLGIKVDLVMKTALKPGIGRRILREVTYV